MSLPSSETSPPGRIADELLVVRCQLGEPDAFDTLIRRWNGPLWTYIQRMTGGDDAAQDVLQDVWLSGIRGNPRLRDGSRLRGWLFGIARRALMDRLRRIYATPPPTDIDAEAIEAEPEPLDREAEIAALEETLHTMPLGEREVLTLFYLRDLSLAEIADALNVPVGTVKSRLFRARKMLRTLMEGKAES